MNGKRGVATDFQLYCFGDDESEDQYTVKLDGGEAFKVKPANVLEACSGGLDLIPWFWWL